MNAHDAAEALRPNFHLHAMPPEDRHHVLFVEAVAEALGIEATSFNLMQVADALEAAKIYPDSNEFPKLMYSRQHHAADGVAASVYDKRNDYVYAQVHSEEEERALGDGWVDSVAALPPRADLPLHREVIVMAADTATVSG